MNNFELSKQYFNSPLQEFVFYDKYSRYRYDLGRRETWVETVDRAVEFLKELSRNKLNEEDYNSIHYAILNMEVMPSMRLMAMAGEAARRNHLSIYNCFRRDTKFVTSVGVKSFEDFEDGDELVVLSHDGSWNKAIVRNYGEQALTKIHFVKGKHKTKDIYVTKNHRWILKDGKSTTSLKTGDYVLPAPNTFEFFNYDSATPFEKLYWCYGYVYGDGTKVKDVNGIHKYSMVRLCGNDVKYTGRFEELGFKTSSSLSLGGDVMVYTGTYLKELPDINKDGVDLVRAFVRGYLDADGAKISESKSNSLSKFSSIQTSSLESCKFIESVFPSVGVVIYGIDNFTGQKTNFATEGRGYTKRYRISTNVDSQYNNCTFSARIDEEYDEIDEVWCLEVENTKSFVLDIGVSTGNCSYVNLYNIESIVEIMTLSMAGVGVGYSVQHKYTDLLPQVPDQIKRSKEVYVVADTSEGWSYALRHHLQSLYDGKLVKFDLGKIRPSGTPLKVKGGRASGPEVMNECLAFITKVFKNAVGRKLKPIEVHDIACCIGYCSISGGVRRTALISLFDSNDEDMLHCKDGDNVINYRWFANNSAVFEEEPSEEEFHKIVDALFDGGRGEPGFYFLGNARTMVPERRDGSKIDGLNPCGEVTLRNMETCNLTSVVCRKGDTLTDLSRKVIIATVIGTIQSMADDFWSVRSKWSDNQKEERLLGVDLSGQMDCNIMVNDTYGHFHEFLKELAVDINSKYASLLGINQAAATTCCKPNGNSSQLVDSSSGIHPRFAPYYIRNVRVSTFTPIYKVLFEAGVPMVPENGQDWSNITTAVVSFPVSAPEGAITRKDMSAIEMCNFWKMNKLKYTEMNPSVTINYKEEEKDEVKQWIWDNRMIIGGMAFLPYSDARYDNMPYIEITKEEYEERIAKFPNIDWSRLEHYEQEDMTNSMQEGACLSGACGL